MTLALYGKTRKRQGGLLLAAFLAVIAASLGALAVVTSTFAHHLESEVYGPTCANDNAWRVRVTEGSWSSYREAVLTITDPTTSVGSLRFTPYLSNGSGTGVILDSGVQAAPVHTAGKVEQYTGSFTDGEPAGVDLPNSSTDAVMTRAGGTAWDADYQPGQVLLWGSELLKITARSGDGLQITVERGFGDTSPASHNDGNDANDDVTRWVRGGLEGSPNTITWDLDAEIVACPQPKLKVVKNVIDHTGADVEDPEDFSFTVTNQTGFDLDDDASSASPLKEKSFVLPAVSGASDVYTITETDAGANGFSLDSITCVGQVGAQGNPSGAGNVSVTVNNTSDVTCTFVNKKAPPVTRKLLVCKNVVDNGVAPTTEGGQFGFTVTGGASTSFNLTSDENDNDGVLLGQIPCGEIINVVEGVATTVSESSLPAGWSHAAGWPKIDNGPAASDPAPGSTSIVVTVKDNSCDNGVTEDGLVGLFHLAGADCVVIFENKMGPVVQQNGTSTVAKTHSGDGTPNLGENFTYTITFTVAGGPLSGQKFFSDILPASLEFQGTPLGTQTDPGNYLTCTNTSTALNCNLADQTPIGVYSQVINVHVKTGATCGPVINSVKIGADTAQGDTVATDTVNVEGCGELGIEKSDSTQTVDAGANIQWTIGLRNSSVVPSTAYVYDAGATLVAPAACSQAGAGTVITCTVPASNGNSTPELLVTVKTAKPTQTGTQMCTPQDVTNTAYLVDSNTEITPGADDPSDSGKFTIPATANANCIKVKKLAAGPGDWNITFTNSGPAADINFSDTYQDGGSSTDIVSIKNSANGDVAGCTPGQPFPDGTKQVSGCNLNLPNGVTVITVHTEVPANSCNGWKVGNTVAAFMGTGSPSQGASIPGDTTEADKTASASYSGDPASCGGTITFVKDDGVVVGSNIRWKITVTSTWQIDKPAMIEDVGTTNVTATLVAGNETCVGTPTMTGDVVTCSVPANSSAYFHVETAIPPYTGANKCIPHTETNVAHLLDAGNTSGNHDANDASDSGEYVIQATADAACITASKSNGVLDADGSVHWTITFSNTGPDATVDMSDAYQQAGTATDIIAASYSGLGCNVVNADTIQDCEVLVVHGLNSATVTLRTERPAGTCGAQTVTNDLTVLYNGQNVVGSPDNGNTYVEPSDEGDCTVTLNLCKQWTIEQGEQVVDGKESFEFTVGSNGNVIISDVEENTHGDCIGLVVTVGEFGEDGLVITEDNIVGQLDLTGFVTPLVSINGGPSVPGPSVTVPLAACQEEPFLKVIDQLLSSIESLVTAGEPAAEPDCTVLFINDDTENNLPTGNIQIEKYLDINGDGDANDAGEGVIPGWEMTTTCQQSIPGADVQDTNASGIVFIPGLAEGDNCTVTEELPSGWQVTRVTVNGANFGPTTSANVTVPGSGATAYVRFFNRQLGGISVHKTTVNVRNGIETVNTNDDDGWTITVKSALCGIDLAIDTDANGNAVFSGLPLCTDYVVAEVLASGEPGYSPVTPASVSGKTPTVGGNTQVNFTNETRSFDPPCPNCTPGTQTVPTPTPTPPTPTPPPCVDCAPGTQTVPTPIPTTGGTNPSPVSTVAGEKTPGPGQTPIAPSTGEGGSGGSSGGLNLMLVLGGLGALAAGITFMAMGRKNRS